MGNVGCLDFAYFGKTRSCKTHSWLSYFCSRLFFFFFFSEPGDQCASYKTRLHNAPSTREARENHLYSMSYSFIKPVLAFFLFSLCCMWLIFFTYCKQNKSIPVFQMNTSITELDGSQPDAFGPYIEPIVLRGSPSRWGFYCWLFPLSLN